MKSWLRLTGITLTIGGGFTLAIGMFETLRSEVTWSNPATLALCVVMAAVSALVTYSGLLAVQDPKCIRPMQIALALQVPWFSSPWFSYKMFSGIGLTAFVSEQPPAVNLFRLSIFHYFGLAVGVDVRFDVSFGSQPWGFGINLVALMLVMALGSYARKSARISAMSEPPLTFPNSTVVR